MPTNELGALLSGSLKNRDNNVVQEALQQLAGWCADNKSEQILLALQIIKNEKPAIDTEILLPLLSHQQAEVRTACIQTLCSLDSSNAHAALMQQLNNKELRNTVLRAIKTGGPNMAALLFSFISGREKDIDNIQLFRFLPCMSADESAWMDLYEHMPECRRALLYRLYMLTYQVGESYKPRVEAYLEKEKSMAIQLCHALYLLEQRKPDSRAYHAMKEDLFICTERMLFLCAMMYGHDKIKKVKDNFSGLSGNKQANAHELLQLVIPQKFYAVIIVLLEESNIEKASKRLLGVEKASFTSLSSLSAKVLDTKDEAFERWCRACFLYSADDPEFGISREMISPWVDSAEPILRETAQYGLEKLTVNA
jgi:hypothetical protein